MKTFSLIKKKYLIHVIGLVIFTLVAMMRFYPQLEGKIINQSDVTSSVAMQHEAQVYNATHSDITYWTNNMFGGMPTYAIWAPMYNGIGIITNTLTLGFESPIGTFIMAMICMYLLLIFLGIGEWVAILMSIAFSLCSNHMILWEAGHVNKLLTVANAGLTIGALYWTYERKGYLISILLSCLAISLSIRSGHIQMTYYLFLSALILGLSYFVSYVRSGELKDFFYRTSSFGIGLLIAVMICFNSLYVQYSFKEDTMRGKPILKNVTVDEASSSSETNGLDWEYAMQWSNGPLDIISTLIPRAAGGGSAESVSSSSEIGKFLKKAGANTKNVKMPYYFGSLPFTSGAVYFGISTFLLFLIAIAQLRGPMQWWLIGSTILLVLLSMGKHAEWFNLPFFKYMPLYNSFRAPNSILTVAWLSILIGAGLGLKELMNGNGSNRKYVYYSTGLLFLICAAIGFVLPSMLDLSGPSDGQIANAGIDLNLFNKDRMSMIRSDALRSIFFLALFFATFVLFEKKYIKSRVFGLLIALIVLLDVAPIGFRYLNSTSWVTKRNNEQAFVPRAVDTQIKNMEPHRGSYRVFDLSINTFNSSITSYHHNTIGGYNAAKLQRFQDLIDRHISQNNMSVLNMLNAKYFITRDQELQVNGQALGNAWFIDQVKKVESPEEEIAALGQINTANTAVILDSEFNNYVGSFDPSADPSNSIALVSYSPKELIYEYEANSEQFVVFSEIWYGPNKGWYSYIDDQEAEHVRVNYTLRGMKVPAGKHTIKFVFEPQIVTMANTISKIGTGLFYVCLIGIGFLWYRGNFKILD